VLDAYVEAGEGELNNERLGRHIEAAYGSLGDGRSKLGETSDIRDAYLEMQGRLYE
jgi:type I restriction enzyme R subunit